MDKILEVFAIIGLMLTIIMASIGIQYYYENKGVTHMGLSDKKLAELGKLYDGAEAIESRPGLPDGEYVALPEEIKLGESKNNNAQVTIAWKVMEGDHESDTQLDFNQCETAQNLGYLKAKMQVLGIELPSHAKEWNDTFEEFTDKNKDLFNIKVVTNKEGYKNTYILGPSEYESGEGTETTEKEEKGKGKEKEKAKEEDIDWADFNTDDQVIIELEDDSEAEGRLLIVREEYIKVEVDGKTVKYPKQEVKSIKKVEVKKTGKKK